MRPRRIVAFLALCTLGLALRPAGAAEAAPTLAVPPAIDATGATDVTSALTQFFASVPAGSTVAFTHGGKYRVDGVLRLVDLQDVTIDGNGAELLAPTDGHAVTPPGPRFRPHWPRLREHVAIHGAHGLVVRDLSIHGPNTDGRYVVALEGQAGFEIDASTQVALQRVSVSNTFGDGVYVAGKSDGVSVADSSFDKIGRQGVAVVNAANVVVQSSRFQAVARSVVDVEPAVPQWTVTGVHVKGNEIGDYGNFALAAGGAGAGVSDVWFENNHVTGGNGLAVFARAPRAVRHGLHINGNTSSVAGKVVTGTGEIGVIQVARFDGVEITGNRQSVAAGAVAVSLDGVCNVTMRDNTFSGASEQQRVVAPCGAAPAPPSARKKAVGAGVAPAKRAASAARGASTDSTWLLIGAVSAVIALLVLGGLLWRTRRRSTT